MLPNSTIITHLLGRRIGPHLVEGLVEGPSVHLSNGTHSMVEGIRSTRVLSDNFRIQASGSTVAHIGGEHIKLAVWDDGSVMENLSYPRVPLNHSLSSQSTTTPPIITARPYRPTAKSADVPPQVRR